MSEEIKKEEFIICPVCGGKGQNKLGLDCKNCGGMGVGTFNFGHFFYWGPKMGWAVIELDRLRRKFQTALNLAAFSAGVAGLLALCVWAYLASRFSQELGAFAFWREKNNLILIFWLSVIADMFVVYRLSQEGEKAAKIKDFSFTEKTKKRKIPDNWTELTSIKFKSKIDVASGFSPSAITTIEKAYLFALKLKHKEVLPVHLFYVSLENKQVAAVFSRLNINGEKLIGKINNYLDKIEPSGGRVIFSNSLKEALVEAYLEANNFGVKKVTEKNFLIPALRQDKMLSEILYDLEVDQDKIKNVILWFIINEKLIESYRMYRRMAQFKPGTAMDRAYTAVATPALNHFSYDLTVAAKWGKLEYCVARDNEIEKIWQNFESGRNGVILVGQPGVGKKTIVDGIAQLMVREDVPEAFKDKRLVELDVSRLVSGASPSEAQQRMLTAVDEIIRAGNILLYIENIESIIGITSGAEESLDLSDVLTQALDKRNFYCVATVTEENFSKYIESSPLGRGMAKVDIDEPAGNQAIQIIESKLGFFEGKYKVYFSYGAIEQVIKMSNRYIHDKYQPQKAIEILELVAVKVSKEKGEQSIVSTEDIAAVISDITHIPVTKLTETESKNLLEMEDLIHARMINQETAVKMVAASLRRARAELREGKRPIANFLFLGPTGVGKTELAKTVSEIYFGSEKYMIRLDMSEYQHPDSIQKMIGDDDSVGYLTESVRKAPFSLVLLDEFEKAHPNILNLFLQVFDDGRLTDGQGRTVDFTNSIIISTSNVGAIFIQDEIFKGTNVETIKTTLINEHLNKVMRPELINRFDGVIVFEPLSMENVVAIARLMLKSVGKMLEAKGVGLRFEDEGVRILAKKGFDPKFGARPLRRLLQDKVEDIIANKILAGELKRRDTVIIDVDANVQVEKAKEL